MILSMNEWTVSGEIFYIKELKGEFAISLKIRGEAKRQEIYTSQVLEFSCLIPRNMYEEAKKKNLKLYKNVSLSGHLETWKKTINGKDKNKIMFIVDYILESA